MMAYTWATAAPASVDLMIVQVSGGGWEGESMGCRIAAGIACTHLLWPWRCCDRLHRNCLGARATLPDRRGDGQQTRRWA